MKDIITVTSKGQATLPVAMRRQLGLGKAGGRLRAVYDERSGQLIITKPLSLDDLSERATRRIKPGTPPLHDVDAYYQARRQVDV